MSTSTEAPVLPEACPNCGAPVEFASAASASAVCGFCRSTLLRDGDTLSQIGQSAEIFEDYSPLQLGASGRWMGSAFTAVGRVQRGSELGNWNEWHLLFDAGGQDETRPRVAWLSEDNGQFVISLEAPLDELPPPQPQVGQPLTLAGQRWQVAAVMDEQARLNFDICGIKRTPMRRLSAAHQSELHGSPQHRTWDRWR